MRLRVLSQGLPLTLARVKRKKHVPRSWAHITLSRTVLGPLMCSSLSLAVCGHGYQHRAFP